MILSDNPAVPSTDGRDGGNNLRRKRLHLERHLAPFLGDQRLDSLSTFTLDRYRKLRRDAGAAVGTINRKWGMPGA
jgi:hypothetical protein